MEYEAGPAWKARGGCPEAHFVHVGCVPCNAARLLGMNLGEVEEGFSRGFVTVAMRDAYRHVWAVSAVRSAAYDHWKAEPHEDARPLVDNLQTAIKLAEEREG